MSREEDFGLRCSYLGIVILTFGLDFTLKYRLDRTILIHIDNILSLYVQFYPYRIASTFSLCARYKHSGSPGASCVSFMPLFLSCFLQSTFRRAEL